MERSHSKCWPLKNPKEDEFEGKTIVKAENLQLEMLNNISIFSFLNDRQRSSINPRQDSKHVTKGMGCENLEKGSSNEKSLISSSITEADWQHFFP